MIIQTKNRFLIRFLVLPVFLLFFLGSCSFLKNTGITTKHTTENEKKQINYRAMFYNGLREKMLGNFSLSEQYFLRCISLLPQRSTPYYELSRLAYASKDYAKALHYAERAHSLSPKNRWFHEWLIQLYEGYNQLGKMEKELKAIIKNNPRYIPYYMKLAEVYTFRRKYKDAIRTYEQVENMQGITETTSIKKEEIYVQLKEYKKAIAEIQTLLKKYPDHWIYYGIMGDIYTLWRQYDEALSAYRTVLKNDSTLAKTYLSMAQMYFELNDTAKAFHAIDSAFRSPYVELDRKLSIMYSYMKFFENRSSYRHYIETLMLDLLKTHPEESKVHLIYADYLIRQKQYAKARSEMVKAQNDNRNQYVFWQQLIYLDAQLNDNKQLYDDAKEALSLFPNVAELYWYGGLGAYFTGRYRQSINWLQKGLEFPQENDVYVKPADYYMYIGESYYHLKLKDSAYYFFDKALQLDSANYMLMNNYAYYLSLDGKNLKKALAMSQKVINHFPNNATYLDTYAWVLYKMKQYDKAKQYIEQAIANSENKGVAFYEHYGDILYRLGQHDKALQQWKKAKTLGKGSSYLELKIKNETLIEK